VIGANAATPLIAEKLAAIAYTGNIAQTQAQLNSLGAGLKVVERLSNPTTGLNAIVTKGAGGRTFIAFQGTQTSNFGSVASYLNPMQAGGLQFAANKGQLAALAAKYPGAVITGHSQGGSLAQLYASAFPNAVKEVVTFNASGIGNAAAQAATQAGVKASHFIAQGDPVSSAGRAFIGGNVQSGIVGGLNPVAMHNYAVSQASTGGVGLVGNPSLQGIRTSVLNSPNFVAQYANTGIKLPRRAVVEGVRSGVGLGLYSAPTLATGAGIYGTQQ
jgi:hypothetical protein